MTNTTTTTATTTTTTTATTNNYDNNNNRKKNPCTYRLPDERALPYCSTHSPVQRGWEGRRPARNRGGVPWGGTVSTRRPCIVVSRRCNAGGERSHQSERHLRPSRERHDTRRKGIEEGGGEAAKERVSDKTFSRKSMFARKVSNAVEIFDLCRTCSWACSQAFAAAPGTIHIDESPRLYRSCDCASTLPCCRVVVRRPADEGRVARPLHGRRVGRRRVN